MATFSGAPPLTTYWNPPKVATGRDKVALAIGGYKEDGTPNLFGQAVSWVPGYNLAQNEMARSYAASNGLTDVSSNIAADFDNRLNKLKTIGGVALGVAGAVTGQPQLISAGAGAATGGLSGLLADGTGTNSPTGQRMFSSFADGGGYGPGPNPAQAKPKGTGVSRFQKAVDEGVAWTKDWYANRPQMKDGMLGLFPTPMVMTNSQVNRALGQVDKPGIPTFGYARGNEIALNHEAPGLYGMSREAGLQDASSTVAHEFAHFADGHTKRKVIQPAIPYEEGSVDRALNRMKEFPSFLVESFGLLNPSKAGDLAYDRYRKGYNERKETWDKSHQTVYSENPATKTLSEIAKTPKKIQDPYLTTPTEVHARLMEWRMGTGTKPKEFITPEMYYKRKADMEKSGKGGFAVKQLYDTLPDKDIINLLNKTVSNQPLMPIMPDPLAEKPEGYVMAKDGGQAGGGLTYAGKKFPGYNKPIKSDRAGKKMMVVAKDGDQVKLIHFGDSSMGHNYSAAARASFKARHAANIARGKMSAAYWANKVLWAGPGGSTKSPPDKSKGKYKEGGGYIKGDAKLYEEDDNTEDNWIVDKKTGQLNGELRAGELIFDQKAAMRIDRLIDKGDLASLGRFIKKERATHPDYTPSFAKGGGYQTFAGGGGKGMFDKKVDGLVKSIDKNKADVTYKGPGINIGAYAGYAMDALGAIGSAVGAGQRLPTNTTTPAWQSYLNEISQRAGMGITDQERMSAERAIETGYGRQVDAINNIGGGSGAAVLSALNSAGRNTQDARLNLELASSDRRRENLGQYGAAVQAQMGVDNQNYGIAYNNALNSRDAYAKSMVANLQQIGNRGSYEESYGPGSAADRLQKQLYQRGVNTQQSAMAPYAGPTLPSYRMAGMMPGQAAVPGQAMPMTMPYIPGTRYNAQTHFTR